MPTTNKIHLDFYSDYYNLGGRAHIFAKATKLIKMELKSSEIDFKLILTKYEQQVLIRKCYTKLSSVDFIL